MKHHFQEWSQKLASDVRNRFEHELAYLDRALSHAKEPTPKAFKETSRANLATPEAKHKLAIAALECAVICRFSHPEDAVALCAALKVLLKGQLPIQSEELERLLKLLTEFSDTDPQLLPVDEVVGQIE